jgi:hypothetical protein
MIFDQKSPFGYQRYVTMDWYHEQGLKLLLKPSYIEEEPDHELMMTTLETIVNKAKYFLTWQQSKWLLDPVKNKITKSWE